MLARAVEHVSQPGGEIVSVPSWQGTRTQHRNEPAREHGAKNLADAVFARTRHDAGLENRLLAQNRRVKLLEGGARLDSQLVDEHATGFLVGA